MLRRMANYASDVLSEQLAIAQALSDSSRVRVLMALRTGELCACQLIELLELSPSTVSRHMGVLRQAGLVQQRRNGRWTNYHLAGAGSSPAVRGALGWLAAVLEGDPRIRADRQLMADILLQDKEELCRRH